MTENDIIALLRTEIDEAQGYDSDVLSDMRAKAMDYYHGKMENSAKGCSDVVSYDVADTVHALMSQIGEIFRASGVEFEGENEEDEEDAQLESDFVQRLLEKNDEFDTFDGAVFDALLQANGWIEVGIDETKHITEETHVGLSIEEATYILEEVNPNESIEVTGEADNFTIIRTLSQKKLDIQSIAPEQMLFSPSAGQFNLNEVRFIAKRHYMTVDDLVEAGMTEEEAKAVPDVADEYWIASVARETPLNEQQDELSGNQEATKLKETYICYILIDEEEDQDGDIMAVQRRKIHLAGSYLISDEFAPFVPFVTGSPLPIPHRIQGQGMYDMMKQVQESKTGVLRSYMDNLKVMNKSRVGYLKGEVVMDELLNGRINGAVGMNRPDALFPLPANDIGAVAIQGLNYLDSVRTSRGGASLDLNNSEMQIASSSATAAANEYSSKEKMAGLYCKNLAHTLLKGTFLMVHATLRLFFNEPMDAKIRGKWIQVNPADWPKREACNLIVGLTQTEKNSKLQGLQTLMAELKELMANGKAGILTDESKYYNAAIDWIKTSSIAANPEQYLIDPTSEEANAAREAQQKQQAEAQAAQQEQQQQILALQKELEKMKDDTNRFVQQTKTDFDYYKADLEAEIKEAQLVIEGIKSKESTNDTKEDRAAVN